jgi:acetyl-CoA carboxylase / biotin carboxylase 1
MNSKIIAPTLLEGGFFKSVEEFTTFSQGDHAIKKILIANNGIGATKAIRSIRRWSFETFGNERMVRCFVFIQFFVLFCW